MSLGFVAVIVVVGSILLFLIVPALVIIGVLVYQRSKNLNQEKQYRSEGDIGTFLVR